MKFLFISILLLTSSLLSAQVDSSAIKKDSNLIIGNEPIMYLDTALRIMNVNPYFTLHVDSVLIYDFVINKNPKDFYWFLTNSPVGVKIDKTTGVLSVKGEKGLFKNGRLKYDIPYRIQLGVQNLRNPNERVDTNFTVLFYSSEIIVSKLKPSTASVINLEEGDSVQFRIQCDEGSFPIEQITVNSNLPISNYSTVRRCNDEFKWNIPFGIFRDNDTAKVKTIVLEFIGTDKFYNRDTAMVRINVKPGINYPVKNKIHQREYDALYVHKQQMKIIFYELSKEVKNNKTTRTVFDIAGASTALGGTIMSTTADPNTSAENIGKILPSIGLTLVPVKEGVAPNKIREQNTASQVRGEVRRLEFVLSENQLNGSRDPEILAKTKRLEDELKKSRLQFLDLPIVEFDESEIEAADQYFNDPKVNKKYGRPKKK